MFSGVLLTYFHQNSSIFYQKLLKLIDIQIARANLVVVGQSSFPNVNSTHAIIPKVFPCFPKISQPQWLCCYQKVKRKCSSTDSSIRGYRRIRRHPVIPINRIPTTTMVSTTTIACWCCSLQVIVLDRPLNVFVSFHYYPLQSNGRNSSRVRPTSTTFWLRSWTSWWRTSERVWPRIRRNVQPRRTNSRCLISFKTFHCWI